MENFFKKIKQTFFYGGLEKEQYQMISRGIDEANRKSIVILSFACLLVYALRLSLGYSKVPNTNKIVFATAIFMFDLVFIVAAPMLFALSAVELAAVVILAEIFYLALIGKFQENQLPRILQAEKFSLLRTMP